MIYRQRKYVSVVSLATGTFTMTLPSGAQVIDYGGLNEYLDTSAGFRGSNEELDAQREHCHYLQKYVEGAVVSCAKNTVRVRGVLMSASGDVGDMEFSAEYRMLPDKIEIDVKRRYLRDVNAVADDSICFLGYDLGSLPTYRAVVPEGDGYIETREENTYFARTGDVDVSSSRKRLQAWSRSSVSGRILRAGREGFELRVLSYSPGNEGLIRVTHPRMSTDAKKPNFCEVEFQWAPGGSRSAGTVQKARMELVPLLSID